MLAFSTHGGLPTAPTLPATTAATAATAVGPGPSLVDIERSSVKFLAVEGLDGGSRRVIRHGHEGEAARPSGVPVGDHGNFLNLAVFGKSGAKRIFAGIEVHVSYIDLQNSYLQTCEEHARCSSVLGVYGSRRSRY